MEYVKGLPCFCRGIAPKQRGYLAENIETEVLVIGGGVTGALALWNFTKRKIPCVLVDAQRFGMRSTSITTALLQYELEDNYDNLVKIMPEPDVRDAYQIGRDALTELDGLIAELGNGCDYLKNDTLLLTSTPKETKALQAEYEHRLSMGFEVEFFEEKDNPTPFHMKAGILSRSGGARLNPYKLTAQLLDASEQAGAKLYENTNIASMPEDGSGFCVEAAYGYTIKAAKVILCTGYDIPMTGGGQFCEKQITYNIVTQPVSGMQDLKLIARDNRTNYHYFRQLPDSSIVFGGGDTKLSQNGIQDDVAQKKYGDLLNYLGSSFLTLPSAPVLDSGFTGLFGVTPDNLGVVGLDKTNPNIMYCLGYGANGILFATIGAKMLAELYCGNAQDKLRLFDPFRPALAGL